MDTEEGEMYEVLHDVSTPDAHIYDPSYEWPEDSSNIISPHSERSTKKPRPNQPSFRLIVLRSSILSSKQKLAVIDGYSEIQFGRDVASVGSTTPKLRLKEMEVSKLHATAYWDTSRREWGIVDMGSVHGTFVRPASTVGNDHGVRLSPPRQASIPRALKHMDTLTIGGTTFLVHMHDDKRPCEECWLGGEGEIPLFPTSKSSKSGTLGRLSESVMRDVGPLSTTGQKDPKKALTMLKQSLMARHNDLSPHPNSTPPTGQTLTQYVDRSARRRALLPTSHSDAPGVCPPSLYSEPPPSRPKSPSIEPVTSRTPLPASNIGHRLLTKQGWEPGMALGSELDPFEGRIGLVEPLEIRMNLDRAGLGVKRGLMSPLSDPDWRENAKRRRWDSTR